MMDYLYGYLSAGVLVWLALLLENRRTGSARLAGSSPIMDALHPERKTLRYRILSGLVAPVLTAVGVVLLWPLGLVMKLQDMAAQRTRVKREEADTFKLKAADLVERMSLADIGQREMVYDPLGAAPQAPFGHAHTAWQKFTEALQPGDEIWRFKSQLTLSWGPQEHRRGYAIQRQGQIVSHFVTHNQRTSAQVLTHE
jgi:hypothetical protein